MPKAEAWRTKSMHSGPRPKFLDFNRLLHDLWLGSACSDKTNAWADHPQWSRWLRWRALHVCFGRLVRLAPMNDIQCILFWLAGVLKATTQSSGSGKEVLSQNAWFVLNRLGSPCNQKWDPAETQHVFLLTCKKKLTVKIFVAPTPSIVSVMSARPHSCCDGTTSFPVNSLSLWVDHPMLQPG